MPPTAERKCLQVGGVRVAVLDRAALVPDPEPPILLLHGLVAEGATFLDLILRLPDNRRVVALDLPGAGYSERSATADVTFSGMAAVVLEVCRELGLERPVLLGHSHGGAVALRVAASYPATISALVLLCPAHPYSRHEKYLVRFYLSAPGRLFAHCLPRLPRSVLLFAMRRMPGSRSSFPDENLEPYLHTLREPGTVAHLLRLLGSWSADMQALAASLDAAPPEVPALFLWGEKDIVVPISSAPELVGKFRRAKLVAMPGIGHLPNEEDAAACAMAIGEWLAQDGGR